MKNYIKRKLDNPSLLRKNKVLVIYGPRRVGKTTIMDSLIGSTGGQIKRVTGDDISVQTTISSRQLEVLEPWLSGISLLAIDEAHEIKEIGKALKLIVDNIEEITVVITGSSSFNIEQATGEPLVGRKTVVHLYPFAQQEVLSLYSNAYELRENLVNYLVFGSYPEAILAETINEKIETITGIVNSYLMKDILAFANLRGALPIFNLLKLLAFQMGSEVSLNELSDKVGIDIKTVGRYIELLEKSFIIKRLTPYSPNRRREITSKNKYYFIDNGIRNGTISQFNGIENRNDIGPLFENFIVMEFFKKQANDRSYGELYFWRNYDKQEIDLLLIKDGYIQPYEIKFNPKAKIKKTSFTDNNHEVLPVKVINSENYLEFLLD